MIFQPFVKDSTPATPGGDFYQQNFNNIFKASFPIPFQAVFAMTPGSAARFNAGMALSLEYGIPVDGEMFLLGRDPFLTLSGRINAGIVAVDSSLMPAAQQSPTGYTAGQAIPSSAILSSLDSAAYPEFVNPGEPVMAPETSWVAGVLGSNANYYGPTAAAIAIQLSANPIPNGRLHLDTDALGNVKRYVAAYPVNPPAGRTLPGWLTWQLQLD